MRKMIFTKKNLLVFANASIFLLTTILAICTQVFIGGNEDKNKVEASTLGVDTGLGQYSISVPALGPSWGSNVNLHMNGGYFQIRNNNNINYRYDNQGVKNSSGTVVSSGPNFRYIPVRENIAGQCSTFGLLYFHPTVHTYTTDQRDFADISYFSDITNWWAPKSAGTVLNILDNAPATNGNFNSSISNRYRLVPIHQDASLQFDGWYNANTGGTKQNYSSSSGWSTSGGSLYARWVKITDTITYDYQGGSGNVTQQTVARGGDTTKVSLPTATRTGYTFKGWWNLPEGSTALRDHVQITSTGTITAGGYGGTAYYTKNGFWDLRGNTTLYARWEIGQFWAYWYPNHSSGVTQSTQHTYATNLTLPTQPTRAGYIFAGWWTTSESSGGTQITSSTAWNWGSNQNFYARWTAHSYTVRFNGNNGTLTGSDPSGTTKSATMGQAFAFTKSATRSNWNFAGWNTKADGTGTWIYNGNNWDVWAATNGATIDVYAQWVTQYKVHYVNALSTNLITFSTHSTNLVSAGSMFPSTLPDWPTRSGDKFLGWKTTACKCENHGDWLVKAGTTTNSYHSAYPYAGGYYSLAPQRGPVFVPPTVGDTYYYYAIWETASVHYVEHGKYSSGVEDYTVESIGTSLTNINNGSATATNVPNGALVNNGLYLRITITGARDFHIVNGGHGFISPGGTSFIAGDRAARDNGNNINTNRDKTVFVVKITSCTTLIYGVI